MATSRLVPAACVKHQAAADEWDDSIVTVSDTRGGEADGGVVQK